MIRVILLMMMTGVIDWNDILHNRTAWNVMVCFATLVTLADGLKRVRFIDGLIYLFALLVLGIPFLINDLVEKALFFKILNM